MRRLIAYQLGMRVLSSQLTQVYRTPELCLTDVEVGKFDDSHSIARLNVHYCQKFLPSNYYGAKQSCHTWRSRLMCLKIVVMDILALISVSNLSSNLVYCHLSVRSGLGLLISSKFINFRHCCRSQPEHWFLY